VTLSSNNLDELTKSLVQRCKLLLPHQTTSIFVANEDELIFFDTGVPVISHFFRTFAHIRGSSFAQNSFVEGDGARKAVVGKEARYLNINDV